jgi:hypothetical protein
VEVMSVGHDYRRAGRRPELRCSSEEFYKRDVEMVFLQ